MVEVLNKDTVVRQKLPALPDQGKWCVMCSEDIEGHKNYK